MDSFLEFPRFPDCVSWGSSGGLGYNTRIIELRNGFEQRNVIWSQARRQYNVATGLRTQTDMNELRNYFIAVRGRGSGFRYKDWSDWHTGEPADAFTPLDEALGTGDGVQTLFPLERTYASPPLAVRMRISKPVVGAVVVAVDGTELTSDWTLDSVLGAVDFAAAPAVGAVLTWGGEYDVPVRFDSDELPVVWESSERQQMQSGSITLLEVRVPLA